MAVFVLLLVGVALNWGIPSPAAHAFLLAAGYAVPALLIFDPVMSWVMRVRPGEYETFLGERFLGISVWRWLCGLGGFGVCVLGLSHVFPAFPTWLSLAGAVTAVTSYALAVEAWVYRDKSAMRPT